MFTVLKKVLENKTIQREDANKVNEFILRRWLSGETRLIELANLLNMSPGKMDMFTVLTGIQKALNGKIKFIKFPSKPKEDITNDENVSMVSKFFEVSQQEAHEYLEWMGAHCPEEIEILKKICKDLEN